MNFVFLHFYRPSDFVLLVLSHKGRLGLYGALVELCSMQNFYRTHSAETSFLEAPSSAAAVLEAPLRELEAPTRRAIVWGLMWLCISR